MPKSRSFGTPSAVTRMFAGLDVAVDDEVAVRVVDGVADLPEEAQAFVDGRVPLVAEAVDGQPLDVLHDEVGEPVLGRPAVEQARDVWVVQGGENLALVAEAAEDEVRVHPALDELDGDAAAELAVVALGHVDGAHPAAADLAHDLVGADPAADGRVFHRLRDERRRVPLDRGPQPRDGERRLLDEVAGLVVLRDERLDLLAQGVVARARLDDVAAALRRRQVERRLEHFLNLFPTFGGHRTECGTRNDE